MKKRLMIFCSLISLLLVGFQFPIYAEEDSSDIPSSVPVPNSIRLDAYFFENYNSLPYIESNGSQYINTGINFDSGYQIDMVGSDVKFTSNFQYLFGCADSSNRFSIAVNLSNDTNTLFRFQLSDLYNSYNYYEPYNLFSIKYNDKSFYLNNSQVSLTTVPDFVIDYPIYIFGSDASGSLATTSSYRLYSFNIKDSDGAYLRYFYPAQSKASGTIGLYDAVSDTFFSSLGPTQFNAPVQAQGLNTNIGLFVNSSLNWIGQILEFAIDTPIIMVFMAIGLAGAMFRWGRRLVHF